jgi:thiol-disulfide isomerase/thioredoxin
MKTLFYLLFTLPAFAFAQLPDINVTDVNNKRIDLNTLKGEKITIVDFWATWCKPCMTAIPKLNTIYTEFSSQGVEIIGVNVDGPRNAAKVKPLSTALNIQYPVVLDPDQKLAAEFNISVFPTLVILNETGKKVFVHEGFNTGDEIIIREKLNSLLSK